MKTPIVTETPVPTATSLDPDDFGYIVREPTQSSSDLGANDAPSWRVTFEHRASRA